MTDGGPNSRTRQDGETCFSLEAGSPAFWEPDAIVASRWSEHVPFAFWLIKALAPRLFVELGTHHGMSYLAFCQAVARLGLPTRCFAVDTWEGDRHAGRLREDLLAALRSRHDAPYGAFSTLLQERFDRAAHRFGEGSIDLLHIDGLHTYAAVRNDFETWLPKMARPGVVLFHDTRVYEDDFGVHRLWAELSAAHPSFEFHHGHGLGVLGVGEGFPESLAALFRSRDGGAEDVRRMFSRLGAGKSQTWREQELQSELEELRGLVERIKGHPVVAAALRARKMAKRALEVVGAGRRS